MAGVVHDLVYCDGENCKQRPLHGIRWKCSQCYDFDLCSDCFMRRRCHDLSHAFYRIDRPNDPWWVEVYSSSCVDNLREDLEMEWERQLRGEQRHSDVMLFLFD